jgi:hypothetical protein
MSSLPPQTSGGAAASLSAAAPPQSSTAGPAAAGASTTPAAAGQSPLLPGDAGVLPPTVVSVPQGAASGSGAPMGPLRRRPQQSQAPDQSGDPDAYAAAEVEAGVIHRAEGGLQFEDRSFLGQLLWYKSKADALDDLVRNWYDPASAARVQRVFTGLKRKQLKVAAYAIGAPVFGTADQTRKSIKNVVRTYHEDAENARQQSGTTLAGGVAKAGETSESSEDEPPSPAPPSPSPRRQAASAVRAVSPSASPPRPRRISSAAAQLLQQVPDTHDRPAAKKVRRSKPTMVLAAPSRGRDSAAASAAAPLLLSSEEDIPCDSDPSDRDEGALFDDQEDARAGHISRGELRQLMGAAGVSKRMFPGFIANAKAASGGRSLYDLYKFEVTPRFKEGSTHSKQECLALSRIIDALLVGDKEGALELACRRLGGVHTAVLPLASSHSEYGQGCCSIVLRGAVGWERGL